MREIAKRAPKDFLAVDKTTSQAALKARKGYVDDMKKKFSELSNEIAACLKSYKKGDTLECRLQFTTFGNGYDVGTITYKMEIGSPSLETSISSQNSGDAKCIKLETYNNRTYCDLKNLKELTGACIYPYLEKFCTEYFRGFEKVTNISLTGKKYTSKHKERIAKIFGKQANDWKKEHGTNNLQIGGTKKIQSH
jgi:hypothetical protein